MNELIIKLISFNLAVSFFYLVYLVIYKKDKAFINRRLFLLFSLGLALLLPFLPGMWKSPASAPFLIHYDLDELVITAKQVTTGPFTVSFRSILIAFYLLISSYFLLRLLLQLGTVIRAAIPGSGSEVQGQAYIPNKKLHGSSFFGWVFLDPESCGNEELIHISRHERVHVRQGHSFDRLLMEVLLVVNWFNPLLWFMRNSIIENHEYLADSAVISEGTDPFHYQLSILNQYIGCATIHNQFSSQIKKRIKMLNVNHSKNGRWKIVFLLPITAMAFFLFSCVEKNQQDEALKSAEASSPTEELFYVVEQMPTFKGEEVGTFRNYIGENLNYPPEAVTAGVQGKVFVHFVITSDGAIRLVKPGEMVDENGKGIEEAITFVPFDEGAADEKIVQLLKNEAERVVLSSNGNWEAGVQRDKKVNVVFTFPISFRLQ